MCQRELDTADTHYQALALLSRAASSSGPPMPGWNITLTYYIVCLHMRAWACKENVHYTQHTKYLAWLAGQEEGKPWWETYRSLENRSRQARYDGAPMGKSELQETIREFNFIMGHLMRTLEKRGLKPKKVDVAPFLS